MSAIISFLDGKKMYLVGFFVVAIGVTEGVFHIDIPGVDVGSDWVGWILAGLGIVGAKSAIAKTEPK